MMIACLLLRTLFFSDTVRMFCLLFWFFSLVWLLWHSLNFPHWCTFDFFLVDFLAAGTASAGLSRSDYSWSEALSKCLHFIFCKFVSCDTLNASYYSNFSVCCCFHYEVNIYGKSMACAGCAGEMSHKKK